MCPKEQRVTADLPAFMRETMNNSSFVSRSATMRGMRCNRLSTAGYVFGNGAGVIAWAFRKTEEEGASCPSF